MYLVYVFEKEHPHDEENLVCGFYSNELEDVYSFLDNINYETHEAVVKFEEIN